MSETNFRKQILETEGYFGEYGGAYIPEVLKNNVDEVRDAFAEAVKDPKFLNELEEGYKNFACRPTPVIHLKNLSSKFGSDVYIKAESMLHTGAHKINHCVGQIILAKRMGRKRIVAETGAGQHGLATAAVCAKYKMPATIYMGKKDYERQRPNVFWMEQMGATVIPVEQGEQTLNDAIIAAFQDLTSNPQTSHYLLGSALGPHPYPVMNTYFQKVVGEEAKKQFKELTGQLPDVVMACAGGGSNAMGILFDFLDEKSKLIAVEAGGVGTETGEHAAKVTYGKVGVFEGFKSYFLQDGNGNISNTSSISAGLDYCGISPILAWLYDQKRVDFTVANDEQALAAAKLMMLEEGIIPALESSHALADGFRLAQEKTGQKILINLSGRGEKDLFILFKKLQPQKYMNFLNSELSELEVLA
jgi:tryptophan synthase beta chain